MIYMMWWQVPGNDCQWDPLCQCLSDALSLEVRRDESHNTPSYATLQLFKLFSGFLNILRKKLYKWSSLIVNRVHFTGLPLQIQRVLLLTPPDYWASAVKSKWIAVSGDFTQTGRCRSRSGESLLTAMRALVDFSRSGGAWWTCRQGGRDDCDLIW